MKKGINILNILSSMMMYIVIVVVLMDSTTMYRFILSSPFYGKAFGTEIAICCFISIVILYINNHHLRLSKSKFYILLPIILMFVIYIFATQYEILTFVKSYVIFFLVMYVYCLFLYATSNMHKFLGCFSDVMLFLSIISLVFWLFGSIMNVLPGRQMITYNWIDDNWPSYTYYYLYFENPLQNVGHGTICNLGIFVEAPSFSGFLLYALIIELVFHQDKKKTRDRGRKNIIRIIIFSVTTVTTNSSKGLLALLVAFVIEYMAKENKTKFGSVLKYLSGFLILIIGSGVTIRIINSKLITSSGIVRIDDMLSGIKTWLQHPLFGTGFGNSMSVMKNQQVIRAGNGLSMGLTVLLAYGGICFLLFYIGAIIILAKSQYFQKRQKAFILVITLLFLNLLISNTGFSDAYIFMIAAAYSSPKRNGSLEVISFDYNRKLNEAI